MSKSPLELWALGLVGLLIAVAAGQSTSAPSAVEAASGQVVPTSSAQPAPLPSSAAPTAPTTVGRPDENGKEAKETSRVKQADQGDKGLIQLTFPENVEVKVLIDYVSKRLKLNILYDDSLVHKKVTIISPSKVPQESLLSLLQSILKITGLALVDADQPGWKRIIATQELLAVSKGVSREPGAFAAAEATAVITQAFQLKLVTTAQADQMIKPFLSKPGGNTFALPDKNLLFVTDYGDVLRRVAAIIELLDQAGPEVSMQFVTVKHWDADELAKKVQALLAEKDHVAGREKESARRLTLTTEPRANQIVLVSVGGAADEALKLIELLDTPADTETQTYRFAHVAPQRIDALAKAFAGAKERYKSSIDAESGLLIVTAAAEVHRHIEKLKEELDVATTEAESHMRFYKLMNATAAQVLGTIRSLEGTAKGGLTSRTVEGLAGPTSILPKETFTGPNQPPTSLGQVSPSPPFYKETPQGPQPQGPQPPKESAGTATTAGANALEGAAGQAAGTVTTKDAVITADPNTNTIIIIAPPAVQEIYAKLIAVLDKRRPQVMIEVTLVTVDTSNGFSLGVQLSKAGDVGDKGRFLTFSSFGLGTTDLTTGAVTLVPGLGFNGVLLDPDTVNVVLKALASDGRSRVVSAPKVLVNDNATGSLSSVKEAPFTSINASQTVSTTSFAGYASAGTTVTVTPHIAEGDHLLLSYAFTLNSFTGDSAGGIPPPRQTNTISSEITVPDGYTVVIGGLTRKDSSETVTKIPGAGDLPLLGYLFSSRSDTRSESTLFVFIRPVILRDDQFADLKYLSEPDRRQVGVAPEYPESRPLVMQ